MRISETDRRFQNHAAVEVSDERGVVIWERTLRTKIAFICMAAVAGKEGDLKALTDDLVRFCTTRTE